MLELLQWCRLCRLAGHVLCSLTVSEPEGFLSSYYCYTPMKNFTLFTLPSSLLTWPDSGLVLSGDRVTALSANGCILHNNESNFFYQVYFILAK